VRLFGAVAGFFSPAGLYQFYQSFYGPECGRPKRWGCVKVIAPAGALDTAIPPRITGAELFFLSCWPLRLPGCCCLFLTGWRLPSLSFPAGVVVAARHDGAAVLVAYWRAFIPLSISRAQAVEVLKGNVSQGARHGGLRSVLVVFQFHYLYHIDGATA